MNTVDEVLALVATFGQGVLRPEHGPYRWLYTETMPMIEDETGAPPMTTASKIDAAITLCQNALAGLGTVETRDDAREVCDRLTKAYNLIIEARCDLYCSTLQLPFAAELRYRTQKADEAIDRKALDPLLAAVESAPLVKLGQGDFERTYPEVGHE